MRDEAGQGGDAGQELGDLNSDSRAAERAVMLWPSPGGITVPGWVCDDPHRGAVTSSRLAEREEDELASEGSGEETKPCIRQRLRSQVLLWIR